MIQEKKTPQIRYILKFLLGFPLTIISFFFIAKFIYSGKDELISQASNFNPLPFFLGIIFLMLFFLLRSLVFRELLKNDGHILGVAESTFLLSNAEIRRYIPGSVLSFVSRIRNFSSLEVPTRVIVKLILYESALFVITSALISIPGAFYFFPEISTVFILPIAILVIAITVVMLKRKELLKHFSAKGELTFGWETPFVLMIFAWVFYGLGNYLISTSLIFIDPSKIAQVSSFFVLSWLAGYLVLIVPMGLGVRESVTTLGLSSLMPVSFAASVALIARIFLVASETLFLILSYSLHKYIHIKQRISYQTLVLWVSIASYISYFTYYSFEKHANFFTGRFDLGNMDQTVWNTIHGRIFQLTNPDGTETISRLAIHADFLLILLAPFYIIWEDPRVLLLIQAVVIGLGAYFIYKISDFVLNNKNLSTIFAVSYLLNPFIQKQNLFDFHAVTLATTLLLASFYFILIKKYKHFLVALTLAVLTKENVYLIAGIFGIFMAFKAKNKIWLALTVSSWVLFYIITSQLIPMARGGQHFGVEYFQDFGESPQEIITTAVLNPFRILSNLLTAQNFAYLIKMFLPLGFVSLLSPLYLIFASPDLAINLLSKNENLKSLTFHYGATIVPFVYLSAIYGLKRILDLKVKFLTSKFASYFIIVLSIYASYQYGVLPGTKNPSLEVYNKSIPEKQEIRRFLQMIPQELSVASTNNLGAHLSHRTKIYTIPFGMKEADVVVFLLNDAYPSPSLAEQHEFARNIQNNSLYIELYRTGDFAAFAKRSAAGKIPSPY